MPGKPKHYTPEFKEQAVKKVVGSSPPRTIIEVACELDIDDTTLGFWIKAAGLRHGWRPGGSLMAAGLCRVQILGLSAPG